jgi:adenosylcobinamide kinase/adenosylcobinamide-phosphate guanylyltransferase
VIGGAASGKSDAALELAGRGLRRAFVATGEALDDEMAEKIRRHRKDRGAAWETAEVPTAVVRWFDEKAGAYDVILLDCITLWLSNLQRDGRDDDAILEEVAGLITRANAGRARVVLVTNELGLGLVPETQSGRRFRDLAGRVNRLLACAADEAYFIVAGCKIALHAGIKR